MVAQQYHSHRGNTSGLVSVHSAYQQPLNKNATPQAGLGGQTNLMQQSKSGNANQLRGNLASMTSRQSQVNKTLAHLVASRQQSLHGPYSLALSSGSISASNHHSQHRMEPVQSASSHTTMQHHHNNHQSLNLSPSGTGGNSSLSSISSAASSCGSPSSTSPTNNLISKPQLAFGQHHNQNNHHHNHNHNHHHLHHHHNSHQNHSHDHQNQHQQQQQQSHNQSSNTHQPAVQHSLGFGVKSTSGSINSSSPTSSIHQQQQQQAQQNSSRYKTELCRPFEENGTCKYGEKCQFAHGIAELRTLTRHPKYKTEFCRTFHTTGFCPYGPRCHFIHNSKTPVGAGAPSFGSISAGSPSSSPTSSSSAMSRAPSTSGSASSGVGRSSCMSSSSSVSVSGSSLSSPSASSSPLSCSPSASPPSSHAHLHRHHQQQHHRVSGQNGSGQRSDEAFGGSGGVNESSSMAYSALAYLRAKSPQRPHQVAGGGGGPNYGVIGQDGDRLARQQPGARSTASTTSGKPSLVNCGVSIGATTNGERRNESDEGGRSFGGGDASETQKLFWLHSHISAAAAAAAAANEGSRWTPPAICASELISSARRTWQMQA